MLVQKKILYLTEILVVLIFSFMNLFSIILIPLNIILGIICLLFLPGYNLLNIIKPKFSLIEKLGYVPIISLAIVNIFMLFLYLILYNLVVSPDIPTSGPFFIFNDGLVLITIQIMTLLLISLSIIKERSKVPPKMNNNSSLTMNFSLIKVRIKQKNFFVYLCFIISMILLCISTFFSNVPYYDTVSEIYFEYRENFPFFLRVPFVFYIFLIISILSLVYIIFYTKNRYSILLSISLFLFCLWILPYLQINNYFSGDSITLAKILKNYSTYGIKNGEYAHFIVRIEVFGAFRYVTSVFTGLLFINFTGMNVDFTLWYLFPLIFIFSPFFFYSFFKRFSKKEESNIKSLMLLTILALFTTQFLKNAHTATTGVIGIYLFFILVFEFFNLMDDFESEDKVKNIVFIIFLFYFLCLTHFEECIYFLLLVFFYGIYFLFKEIKVIKQGYDTPNKKRLKKNFTLFGSLFMILILFIYLMNEYFGFFSSYISRLVHFSKAFEPIYLLYETSKISIFGIRISIFVMSILIAGPILIFIGLYVLLFNYYSFVNKLYIRSLKGFKSIFNLIKKIFSYKFVQILIIPVLWITLLVINVYYFKFIQEEGVFIILEVILSYTIIIFHVFLFIKGLQYYQVKNDKQNYFLISIIASSSIFVVMLLLGEAIFSFYLLNSRILPYFIIFNLVIIQTTYFKEFMKKQRYLLVLILITLFFLGSFYSLRKLAWG